MMHRGNQDLSERGAQEEAFPALRGGDINSAICTKPDISSFKYGIEVFKNNGSI